MIYPALLPLMRTPRLPVVYWTYAHTDINGLALSPIDEIWFLRVCHHISNTVDHATTCSFHIISSSFFTINKSFDTVELEFLTASLNSLLVAVKQAMYCTIQACWTFYVVRETSTKFCLLVGSMIEVGECLLSFGAEAFVFPFVIQKLKD